MKILTRINLYQEIIGWGVVLTENKICSYPLNLQVSVLILKWLPKPLQLPE